jgi:photosystem II stability/assembly factor-like uncharacterized protein
MAVAVVVMSSVNVSDYKQLLVTTTVIRAVTVVVTVTAVVTVAAVVTATAAVPVTALVLETAALAVPLAVVATTNHGMLMQALSIGLSGDTNRFGGMNNKFNRVPARALGLGRKSSAVR